jgi:hypothetical protein
MFLGRQRATISHKNFTKYYVYSKKYIFANYLIQKISNKTT